MPKRLEMQKNFKSPVNLHKKSIKPGSKTWSVNLKNLKNKQHYSAK